MKTQILQSFEKKEKTNKKSTETNYPIQVIQELLKLIMAQQN